MEDKSKYVQHPLPPWADPPNYVIHGAGMYEGATVTEQLWARKADDDTFELLCLPFYLYGLALGDTVRCAPSDELMVVTRSGRELIRVWFPTGCADPEAFDGQVGEFGARTEWYSHRYVAIDVGPDQAQELRSWLEQSGFEYEDASRLPKQRQGEDAQN
jgi:hypothetical protein